MISEVLTDKFLESSLTFRNLVSLEGDADPKNNRKQTPPPPPKGTDPQKAQRFQPAPPCALRWEEEIKEAAEEQQT